MKFHHVGIACRDIAEEIDYIRRIHLVVEQSSVLYDSEQNAELCLLSLKDGVKIELISGKKIDTILKRHIRYYHLCYEVDDINAEMQKLIENGALLISPPKPAILFENRQVAFLNVSYGIIELLNSK
jgi:methylmalonyl-CoA/ethylmalonyl-CoA epimerase